MIEVNRVLLGGVQLNVAQTGLDNDELMLCLHGFPENHLSWRAFLRAFADRFHVVAPDNRGFGASDKPTSVSGYAMSTIVGDIHALVSHLGKKPFTLIGHDWGGIVAWHFAAQYPELLERMIVINAPHPTIFQQALINDPKQRAASQYINRFRDPACEERLMSMGLEAFWDSLFGVHLASAAMSEDDKRNQLECWARPGALTAMLNWYRASDLVVGDDSTPLLTTQFTDPAPVVVNVPTLVIWGMQDQLLLPGLLDGLQRYVPRLTIKKIQSGGHGLVHEMPDQIIGLIREYIDLT